MQDDYQKHDCKLLLAAYHMLLHGGRGSLGIEAHPLFFHTSNCPCTGESHTASRAPDLCPWSSSCTGYKPWCPSAESIPVEDEQISKAGKLLWCSTFHWVSSISRQQLQSSELNLPSGKKVDLDKGKLLRLTCKAHIRCKRYDWVVFTQRCGHFFYRFQTRQDATQGLTW